MSDHYAATRLRAEAPIDPSLPPTIPFKKILKSQIARFHSYVDRIAGPDACWPWLGKPNKEGYGRINFVGDVYLAHRVAFYLSGQELLPGKMVCHRCNNRICCNPSHHYAGDKKTNGKDMVEAGRCGHMTHPHRVRRGENNGNSVLNDIQVVEARDLYAFGYAASFLAKKYGIDYTNMVRAITGVNYSHLPSATQLRSGRQDASRIAVTGLV